MHTIHQKFKTTPIINLPRLSIMMALRRSQSSNRISRLQCWWEWSQIKYRKGLAVLAQVKAEGVLKHPEPPIHSCVRM